MTTVPTSPLRLARVLPLAVAAVLVVVGIVTAAGALGAVVVAAIAAFGAALAVWVRGAEAAERLVVARTATAALLCCPALLILFFSFSSGGFFPDSVALGVLAVALLLVVRLALAADPLAGFGPRALVPAGALALFAGWILLSQRWSHAPGRATVEFDRALLYALTFVLFASLGRTRARITWALRGCALVMGAVAALALLSRVAPDVLATGQVGTEKRLAFPLTYWNALGVFCALGAVLCLHLAAADGNRAVRVAATGVLPVFGAVLMLTFSRGGLAAAGLGLVLYVVLGRPRALVCALVAGLPLSVVAMKAAYDATLLSSDTPTSRAAIHEGHHVALVVLGCVAGVVVLRAVLLAVDARLERARWPLEGRRRAEAGAWVVGCLAAVAVAVALGAPSAVSDRWDQFVHQRSVPAGTELRSRLSSASNQGRIEHWDAALDGYRAQPVHGTGAGTFEVLWYEHRKGLNIVVDGHSLYIETLGELGIVGLALVLIVVLGVLTGLAPFGRGRDRALYAALFSAGVVWAVHAGVDWDWEMPAVTLWFMALGGLALGRRRMARAEAAALSLRTFALGAVIVGVAIIPALVLASQARLNAATNALAQGDCARADRMAHRAIDLLGTRSGPWHLIALCDARGRRFGDAQLALRSGLAKDPENWRLHAALAAAIAAGGGDARGEAAVAQRLNPNERDVAALAAGVARGRSKAAKAAGTAFLNRQSLTVSG